MQLKLTLFKYQGKWFIVVKSWHKTSSWKRQKTCPEFFFCRKLFLHNSICLSLEKAKIISIFFSKILLLLWRKKNSNFFCLSCAHHFITRSKKFNLFIFCRNFFYWLLKKFLLPLTTISFCSTNFFRLRPHTICIFCFRLSHCIFIGIVLSHTLSLSLSISLLFPI